MPSLQNLVVRPQTPRVRYLSLLALVEDADFFIVLTVKIGHLRAVRERAAPVVAP